MHSLPHLWKPLAVCVNCKQTFSCLLTSITWCPGIWASRRGHDPGRERGVVDIIHLGQRKGKASLLVLTHKHHTLASSTHPSFTIIASSSSPPPSLTKHFTLFYIFSYRSSLIKLLLLKKQWYFHTAVVCARQSHPSSSSQTIVNTR